MPNCTDVERLVLGYCLLNSSYMDVARGALETEDFVYERHVLVWGAMCAIYDSGASVDRITVMQHLRESGNFDKVGGFSYLVDLDTGLPEKPSIDAYITELRDYKTRRRVIFSAQHIANLAYETSNEVEHVLGRFGSAAMEVTCSGVAKKPTSTTELIDTVGVSALLKPREESGLRLPWASLNNALGGFEPGQVIVLMAATSRGKTSMALQIATCAAMQGGVPAIWTMEMSPKALFQRMVTQISGVYATKRMKDNEEREAHRAAVERLNDFPIYFDYHSRSVPAFIASLRQIKAKNQLGLVVVDHLQLIPPSGNSRYADVSSNSSNLASAARELEVPFLVLSQVDRGSVKGDGEIGIHSAKESGNIENDADVVMWIKSPPFFRDVETPCELWIGKQREGASGFSIPMAFSPVSQSFLELG